MPLFPFLHQWCPSCFPWKPSLGQWSNPSSPPPKPTFLIFLLSSSFQHIPALNLCLTNIQPFTRTALDSSHSYELHLHLDGSKQVLYKHNETPDHYHHTTPHICTSSSLPISGNVFTVYVVTQAKNLSHPSFFFSPYPQHHLVYPIGDSTTKTYPKSDPFSPFSGLPVWSKPCLPLCWIIQHLLINVSKLELMLSSTIHSSQSSQREFDSCKSDHVTTLFKIHQWCLFS